MHISLRRPELCTCHRCSSIHLGLREAFILAPQFEAPRTMAEPNTVPPSRPLFTANPALQSLRMSTSRQPFIAHSPLEPFTSWFSGKTKIPDDKPTELPTASTDALDIHHLAPSVYTEITSSPAAVAALSAISATTLTLISVVVYRKYIKRIRNADYVTSGMIQERKWIKGIVTRCVESIGFCAFLLGMLMRTML